MNPINYIKTIVYQIGRNLRLSLTCIIKFDVIKTNICFKGLMAELCKFIASFDGPIASGNRKICKQIN